MEPTLRSGSTSQDMNVETHRPPLGALFRRLTADASSLLRQEVALARAELAENVHDMAHHLRSAAIGGAIALVGALVLVAFLVALLGDLFADLYWLAALLVGVLFVAVGGWLILRGVRRLRDDSLKPETTVQSLKETREWAKVQTAEFRHALRSDPAPAVRLSPQPPPAPSAHASARASTSRAKKAEGDNTPPDEKQGNLAQRIWHEIGEDDLPGQAAKLAYYAFLALPPTFMVLFGLTGFFGSAGAADWITEQLRQVLPGSASELIQTFVEQVVYDQAPGAFSFGLLLALWSASNIFMGLGDTLNTAYDIEEERSWIKRRAIAVGVMLVTVVLILGGGAFILAGPAIGDALGLSGVVDVLWTVLRWPLTLLLVVGAFWIMYYALPNRDQSAYKITLLKGAAAAAVLWLLATAAFRLYVANFSSYSESYGFLGAVIVLLLWLYITGLVVLIGGELNAELEERRGAA